MRAERAKIMYSEIMARATVRTNYTMGGKELMIWGRKPYTGLLASILIAPEYDAAEWNIRHGMEKVDTLTAEDGKVYDIYYGNGYISAVPVQEEKI